MTLILGVLRLVAILIVATLMVAYTIVLLPFLFLAVKIERAWKSLRNEEADDPEATGFTHVPYAGENELEGDAETRDKPGRC